MNRGSFEGVNLIVKADPNLNGVSLPPVKDNVASWKIEAETLNYEILDNGWIHVRIKPLKPESRRIEQKALPKESRTQRQQRRASKRKVLAPRPQKDAVVESEKSKPMTPESANKGKVNSSASNAGRRSPSEVHSSPSKADHHSVSDISTSDVESVADAQEAHPDFSVDKEVTDLSADKGLPMEYHPDFSIDKGLPCGSHPDLSIDKGWHPDMSIDKSLPLGSGGSSHPNIDTTPFARHEGGMLPRKRSREPMSSLRCPDLQLSVVPVPSDKLGKLSNSNVRKRDRQDAKKQNDKDRIRNEKPSQPVSPELVPEKPEPKKPRRERSPVKSTGTRLPDDRRSRHPDDSVDKSLHPDLSLSKEDNLAHPKNPEYNYKHVVHPPPLRVGTNSTKNADKGKEES